MAEAWRRNNGQTPDTLYPFYCYAVSPTYGRWCPLQASDVFALTKYQQFEGQSIYHYKNLPIKYVRLTGIIIDINEYPSFSANGKGRWIATLDDGSGVAIEVLCEAPPRPDPPSILDGDKSPHIDATTRNITTGSQAEISLISPDGPDLTGLDIGSVVKVKGGITEFRGARQIQLKKIWDLSSTRKCDLRKDGKVADERGTNEETRCWKEVVEFRRDVLSKPWILSEEEVKKCEEDERESIIEEQKQAAQEMKEQERKKRRAERETMRQKQEELRSKQKIKHEEPQAKRHEKTSEGRHTAKPHKPNDDALTAEKKSEQLRIQFARKQSELRKKTLESSHHSRVDELKRSSTTRTDHSKRIKHDRERIDSRTSSKALDPATANNCPTIKYIKTEYVHVQAHQHDPKVIKPVFTTAATELKRMREELLSLAQSGKTRRRSRHDSRSPNLAGGETIPVRMGLPT